MREREYKVRYINEKTAQVQKGPIKIDIHFSSGAMDLIGYHLKEIVENSEGYAGFEKFMKSLPSGGMRIIETGDCFEVIKKREIETESIDKMLIKERPDEEIPLINIDNKTEVQKKLRRKRRDTSSVIRIKEIFGKDEYENLFETEYDEN
ncbi:hypothetical protein KY304_00010 [Candidatus Woesearchaeota archaeon]|nr:hypothetical protein [Candidatus Woesearchaeota archaeon]